MKINKSKLFKQFFDKAKDRKIKHLVLHHIASKNFNSAISDLKKSEVSSHYIIDLSGEIFLLVKEKNIAYHAGVSFWHGQDGLNKSSIGIEFYNPKPFEKNFSEPQIAAGIALSKKIIKKYKILRSNVIGHSDIAYFRDDEENKSKKVAGCLGRKQDPSHLFPWDEFYKNGVGRKISKNILKLVKQVESSKKARSEEIKELKTKLKNFGYKIDKINSSFDSQLKSVIEVVASKLK